MEKTFHAIGEKFGLSLATHHAFAKRRSQEFTQGLDNFP